MGNVAVTAVGAYRINSKLEFLKKEEVYNNELPPYSQDEKTKHHLFNFCAVTLKNGIQNPELKRSTSRRVASVKSLQNVKQGNLKESSGSKSKSATNSDAAAEQKPAVEVPEPDLDDDLPVDAKGFLLVVTEITRDQVLFRDPKKLDRTVHSVRLDEIKTYQSGKYGYTVSLNVQYDLTGQREQIRILCDMSDKICATIKLETRNYAAYLNDLFESYIANIESGTPRNFTKISHDIDGHAVLVNIAVSKDAFVIAKYIEGEKEIRPQDVLHTIGWLPNDKNDNLVIITFQNIENTLSLSVAEAKHFSAEKPEVRVLKFNSPKCAEVSRVLALTKDYIAKQREKEKKQAKKEETKLHKG